MEPTDPTSSSVPPQPGSPLPGGPSPSGLTKDERLWASIAHLSGILTSFLGPLIVWFLKREESRFVDDQAKEATNFQISVAIVMVASFILMFIPVINCFIWVVPIVAWIASVVFAIISAVKANEGATYRYPITIRLLQ